MQALSSSAQEVSVPALKTRTGKINRSAATVEFNSRPETEIDPIKTCLTLQAELHNWGKALSCPLCLSTLRDPTLLPCNHAFCRACITTYFDPKHNRTISRTTGKHSFKNQCPICKAHCTKRGTQQNEDMAELVKAYKESLRSFGFTPIVYDEKVDIAMTQIEETFDFGGGDDNDDDDIPTFSRDKQQDEDDDHQEQKQEHNRGSSLRSRATSAKGDVGTSKRVSEKSIPDLRQVHEHYEVSKGIAGILKKAFHKSKHELDRESIDTSGEKVDVIGDNHENGKATNDNSRPKRNRKTFSLSPRLQIIEPDLPNTRKRKKMNVEEIERRNEVRKLNYLLKDQEKVVQVDERALVRAAVSKQKRNSRSGSLEGTSTSNGIESRNANGTNCKKKLKQSKDELSIENDGDNDHLSKVRMDQGGKINAGCNKTCSQSQQPQKVDEEMVDFGDDRRDEEEDDVDEYVIENTQRKLERAMNAIETSEQVLAEAPESQSQMFFSVPDDLNSSVSAAAPSSKAGEIPTTTQELMDDAREKEAADRSGEWLEHEVEIEEQTNNVDDSNITATRTSKLKESSLTYGNMSSRASSSQITASDRFFSALSEQEKNEELPLQKNSVKNHFTEGTLVQVQDRTWPGVNKPGGVARIINVYANVAGVKYDVKYVLGGKEKMVDSAFVKEHQDSRGSFSSCSNSQRNVSVANKSDESTVTSTLSRKSRRVDERNQVEEWIIQIDEEEKKKRNSDMVAEVSTRRSKRVAKVKVDDKDKRKILHSEKKKKNIKMITRMEPSEKKGKNKKTSSKAKTNSTSSGSSEQIERGLFSEPQQPNLSQKSMTLRNIIESATLHYSKICEKHSLPKRKKSAHTVFITCSTLDKGDQSIVQKMIVAMSGTCHDGKVKLLKDFNPYKTSILVTSSLRKGKDCEKIAKLRTMKAMRSALTGVPIVDASWCKACISENKIIAPRSDHCITSLPTKLSGFMENLDHTSNIDEIRNCDTAVYGVPSLVASRPSLLFQNTSIFLCGTEWKNETTKSKDIQLLLREGGGLVLTSAFQATKSIKEELEHPFNKKIVLLCDDTRNDKANGITAPLSKVIRQLYSDKEVQKAAPVLVVNSTWLFDSISCAKLLDSNSFQPFSPLAISLSQLCCIGVE